MTRWVFDPERLAQAEAVRNRNLARGKRNDNVTVRDLGRRLTALEQLALVVRRREIRNLVHNMLEAHDLTPAEVEDVVADVERSDAWRREGLSSQDCLKRQAEEIAAEFGMAIDEVLSGAGVNLEHYR